MKRNTIIYNVEKMRKELTEGCGNGKFSFCTFRTALELPIFCLNLACKSKEPEDYINWFNEMMQERSKIICDVDKRYKLDIENPDLSEDDYSHNITWGHVIYKLYLETNYGRFYNSGVDAVDMIDPDKINVYLECPNPLKLNSYHYGHLSDARASKADMVYHIDYQQLMYDLTTCALLYLDKLDGCELYKPSFKISRTML